MLGNVSLTKGLLFERSAFIAGLESEELFWASDKGEPRPISRAVSRDWTTFEFEAYS